jgi:hypothetical protein
MRQRDIARIIAEEIPNCLDSLNVDWARAIDEGSLIEESHTFVNLDHYDRLESVINVIKALAQSTLSWIKNLTTDMGNKFASEFNQSMIEKAGLIGRHAPTVTFGVLATVILQNFSWIASAHPWIDEILRLVSSLSLH